MENQLLGISENRIKHMLQVARTAEWLARELFIWPEEKCRQMFVLGLLHDLGYEYATDQLEHAAVGGSLLEEAGYRYWQEVRWHSTPDAPYASEELLLLNMADFLTSPEGGRVSIDERLQDIEERYGSDSIQLTNAKRLAESFPLCPVCEQTN